MIPFTLREGQEEVSELFIRPTGTMPINDECIIYV